MSFQALANPKSDVLAGFSKISNVAKSRGYQYIWIDTCCIDKTAVLSCQRPLIQCGNSINTAGFYVAYLQDAEIGPVATKD